MIHFLVVALVAFRLVPTPVPAADKPVKVFILAGQSNMKHFIKDVRQDLDAPKLPFVIAAMGDAMLELMKHQN